MTERLMDFSISGESFTLTQSRNQHYNKITCSIICNSITLLIFIIVQGYILRSHQDWDAIIVLILACITILLEGLTLLQVFHMQTFRLIITTSIIIVLELLIIGISIYQTMTEAFEKDTAFEIIVQISAIVIFILVSIFKAIIAYRLVGVFEMTKISNQIKDGMKNKEAYENFSKTLR